MNKDKKNGKQVGEIITLLAVFSVFTDSLWAGLALIVIVLIVLWTVWTKKKQEETGDKSARMSFNEFWQRLKFEAQDFFSNNSDDSDDDDEDDEEYDTDYGDFTEVKDEPDADDNDDEPDDIPQEKGSFSKWFTEVKKEEEMESCEADHAHFEQYSTMSDDEKRREQLDRMLENGIIDKKEYKLLLKKYGLK